MGFCEAKRAMVRKNKMYVYIREENAFLRGFSRIVFFFVSLA
jgi:hypothetical protein